jgi:hypothetical protein
LKKCLATFSIRTALRQRHLVLAGSLRLLFTGWQILRQFPVEAPLGALFAEQGGDEASKRGVVIWA